MLSSHPNSDFHIMQTQKIYQYLQRTSAILMAMLCALTTYSLEAHAGSAFKDKQGASDYPLVSRYQGSIIDNYGSNNFESVVVPVSATKNETIEGKLYNYFYLAPKDRSALEVFRSYKLALEKSRFKVIFACEDAPVCMEQGLDKHSEFWTDKTTTYFGGYAPTNRMGNNGNYPPRFLVARLSRPEGDVTAVLTIKEASSTEINRGAGPAYFLQIIETAAMQTGNVTIKSDALKTGIATEGKIALYGIYFDTGKAEIKSGSKIQLDEMAKLLNQQKNLKVFIVGHTDNQGELELNVGLSQKRAEAIANVLIKEYKIEPKRLLARGAANLSPIASNANESGRSKNRRVELVEQ
jgi:OOP family OmpA-OmpF porin